MEFWGAHVREIGTTKYWHIYGITEKPGKYPLPSAILPGTEAITGPMDFALDRGDYSEAGRLAVDALAKYPLFSRYLNDRLQRARHRQPSYLPLKRDDN